MQVNSQIELMRQFVHRKLEVWPEFVAVLIVGSVAHEEARSDSDVDCVLVFDKLEPVRHLGREGVDHRQHGYHAPPPYPTDGSDDEWAFLAPYLTLMRDDAPQRTHDLRELFNGLRYIVRTGLQWRSMPNDLPPWHAVYDQPRRWLAVGVFAAIVADLRELIRIGEGRAPQPSAVMFDSRTLQSTPESGARAGWDGAKRRTGSKVHLAVDTLGQLRALHVTPANAQDRAEVAELAAAVQAATGETVTLAYVDQGYTGAAPQQAAADAGSTLAVVKLPDIKRGFVLLPRRWVMERDFGWLSRVRRLARDQERLAEGLEGVHLIAFIMLIWKQVLPVLSVL